MRVKKCAHSPPTNHPESVRKSICGCHRLPLRVAPLSGIEPAHFGALLSPWLCQLSYSGVCPRRGAAEDGRGLHRPAAGVRASRGAEVGEPSALLS